MDTKAHQKLSTAATAERGCRGGFSLLELIVVLAVAFRARRRRRSKQTLDDDMAATGMPDAR